MGAKSPKNKRGRTQEENEPVEKKKRAKRGTGSYKQPLTPAIVKTTSATGSKAAGISKANDSRPSPKKMMMRSERT